MKIRSFFILSLMVVTMIALFQMTSKPLPVKITEKEYVCTVSECKYEVVIKNNSGETQLAELHVTGLTTTTKFKRAQKVEQSYVLNLNVGESQIIKGQITIPVARVVLFNVKVKH